MSYFRETETVVVKLMRINYSPISVKAALIEIRFILSHSNNYLLSYLPNATENSFLITFRFPLIGLIFVGTFPLGYVLVTGISIHLKPFLAA